MSADPVRAYAEACKAEAEAWVMAHEARPGVCPRAADFRRAATAVERKRVEDAYASLPATLQRAVQAPEGNAVTEDRRSEATRTAIATLNAETAAGMQSALRAAESEVARLKDWQSVALELLWELDPYLDQRADYDMEGDPPRFVPNREARFLYDLRELIARAKK